MTIAELPYALQDIEMARFFLKGPPGPRPERFGDDVQWDEEAHRWKKPGSASAADPPKKPTMVLPARRPEPSSAVEVGAEVDLSRAELVEWNTRVLTEVGDITQSPAYHPYVSKPRTAIERDVHEYVRMGYLQLNQQMRAGEVLSGRQKEICESLVEASKSIESSTPVFRGMGLLPETLQRLEAGEGLTLDAFTSTSRSPLKAMEFTQAAESKIFGEDVPVFLTITVKDGKGIVYGGSMEHETILAAGQNLRLTEPPKKVQYHDVTGITVTMLSMEVGSEGSVELTKAAPGPPPRPGLVWHEETHRWRRSDHDEARGDESIPHFEDKEEWNKKPYPFSVEVGARVRVAEGDSRVGEVVNSRYISGQGAGYETEVRFEDGSVETYNSKELLVYKFISAEQQAQGWESIRQRHKDVAAREGQKTAKRLADQVWRAQRQSDIAQSNIGQPPPTSTSSLSASIADGHVNLAGLMKTGSSARGGKNSSKKMTAYVPLKHSWALKSYMDSVVSVQINDALRSGTPNMFKEVTESLIDLVTPIGDARTVYRALNGYEGPAMAVGQTLKFEAFSSTARDPHFAAHFLGDAADGESNVFFEIHTGADTRGIITTPSGDQVYPGNEETILAPGQRFQVDHVEDLTMERRTFASFGMGEAEIGVVKTRYVRLSVVSDADLQKMQLDLAAPGPPPRPGLIWHEETHRWRRSTEGQESVGERELPARDPGIVSRIEEFEQALGVRNQYGEPVAAIQMETAWRAAGGLAVERAIEAAPSYVNAQKNRAVMRYTRFGDKALNEYMRQGVVDRGHGRQRDGSAAAEQYDEEFDPITNKPIRGKKLILADIEQLLQSMTPLQEAQLLFRGMDSEMSGSLKAKQVGEVIPLDGLSSFSRNPSVAFDFSGKAEGSTILVLEASGHAVGMTLSNDDTWRPEEETVLAPGQYLQILDKAERPVMGAVRDPDTLWGSKWAEVTTMWITCIVVEDQVGSEGSVELTKAAPGPPPRPGLIWHDETSRWRREDTGEVHETKPSKDYKVGDTVKWQTKGGKEMTGEVMGLQPKSGKVAVKFPSGKTWPLDPRLIEPHEDQSEDSPATSIEETIKEIQTQLEDLKGQLSGVDQPPQEEAEPPSDDSQGEVGSEPQPSAVPWAAEIAASAQKLGTVSSQMDMSIKYGVGKAFHEEMQTISARTRAMRNRWNAGEIEGWQDELLQLHGTLQELGSRMPKKDSGSVVYAAKVLEQHLKTMGVTTAAPAEVPKTPKTSAPLAIPKPSSSPAPSSAPPSSSEPIMPSEPTERPVTSRPGYDGARFGHDAEFSMVSAATGTALSTALAMGSGANPMQEDMPIPIHIKGAVRATYAHKVAGQAKHFLFNLKPHLQQKMQRALEDKPISLHAGKTFAEERNKHGSTNAKVLGFCTDRHGVHLPTGASHLTVSHELAHQMDFANIGLPVATVTKLHANAVRSGNIVSEYSRTNPAEYWAEGVENYLHKPERLRKRDLPLYLEIQRVMQ